MTKESKVIVFSGGCFSGKTTALEHTARLLRNDGVDVTIMNELMRSKKIESIDSIRAKPSDYLKLQNEIIREKIECENSVFESKEKLVVLVDRSIIDSMFYLVFYVDKSQLNYNEIVLYNNLLVDTMSHAKFAHENIYDYIATFKPLDHNKNAGLFRPQNNHVLKYIESSLINTLSIPFIRESSNAHIRHYDLNVQHVFDVAIEISSWYTK